LSKSVCVERPLEMILAVLGEEGRDVEDRLASASGIAKTALSSEAEAERKAWLKRSLETGLRWEIIEGLTHIAGFWKWRRHESFSEIGHELTRLTLDGVSMTDELPGQEVYGAFGQDFKTSLASTFERLRDVFPEDCGGVSNWKDRIEAAGEIARDALGVVRHMVLTLDLVDSVSPANRLIVEEAIGRGMVVWRSRRTWD